MRNGPRDHGGNLDAAIAQFGGTRADWIDLSTGINPCPYPLPALSDDTWTALPDAGANDRLTDAARAFWRVPDAAGIVASPGASALIAQIPRLASPGKVAIPTPTYNEHAAAFAAQGWTVTRQPRASDNAQVVVHPNNPDGRLWSAQDIKAPLDIIDESFGDICPDRSLVAMAARPGTLVLKSFGKFWGLAGLRLGFAIGDPKLIARLGAMLGPWPVSGPALQIGATALADTGWADTTRERLAADAARLDGLMTVKGANPVGGTNLFRLYDVEDAHAWQTRLAEAHIWSRVFPYNPRWLRLGLPPARGWAMIEAA